MRYANQKLEPCPEETNQYAKTRSRTSPGFSRVRILLLIVCSTYGFSIGHTEEREAGAPTNPAKSEIATVKRPVTVADSIEMTQLGDPSYAGGVPSKGIVAKFSPDGKRFVVVLKRG